nr:MAG TPA: hypothetical protein [Caudoviricetes sp.]
MTARGIKKPGVKKDCFMWRTIFSKRRTAKRILPCKQQIKSKERTGVLMCQHEEMLAI